MFETLHFGTVIIGEGEGPRERHTDFETLVRKFDSGEKEHCSRDKVPREEAA